MKKVFIDTNLRTKNNTILVGNFIADNKGLVERKYPCPCCGNDTLTEQPPGTYEICPVCKWEDDELQFKDPTYKGGANGLSLEEARRQYQDLRKE